MSKSSFVENASDSIHDCAIHSFADTILSACVRTGELLFNAVILTDLLELGQVCRVLIRSVLTTAVGVQDLDLIPLMLHKLQVLLEVCFDI